MRCLRFRSHDCDANIDVHHIHQQTHISNVVLIDHRQATYIQIIANIVRLHHRHAKYKNNIANIVLLNHTYTVETYD